MRSQFYFLVILILVAVSFAACAHFARPKSAPKILLLSAAVLKTRNLPFIEHVGPTDDPYATALAMNIAYDPMKNLKESIERTLGTQRPLKFFQGWEKNGEAHVTVITPPEYHFKLRQFVPPEHMNKIARDLKIQESDLEILGLGRGQAVLDGKMEDTYFVIVRSENLLRIRRAVYAEFLKNGGEASAWDPERFYPHITVGYTGARDLHEQDGVIKDLPNSLDKRFKLTMTEMAEL